MFKDGNPMKRVEDAVYLGASITREIEPRLEIRRRISMTMPVLKKLDIFWNKTKCCKAWKIQVLNAVIVSKLIYGLETIEPTAGVSNMLDTFQLKGLRKILEMKTTFIDRANTNQKVYQCAQNLLNTKNLTKKAHNQKPESWLARQVRPLTMVLEEKKLNMLGHVIRRDFSHPLQQVTFDTAANTRYGRPLAIKEQWGKRRQGRPRLHWTHENMRKAWDHIRTQENVVPDNLKTQPYDNKDPEKNKIIAERARLYKTPFQGSENIKRFMEEALQDNEY